MNLAVPRKVLLISFFDSQNIGDIAITKAICNSLVQFDIIKMDFSGSLFSPNSNSSNADCSVISSPRKKRIIPFKRIRTLFSVLRPKRYKQFKSIIKSVDVVLLAGGNMIMDLEKTPFYSLIVSNYIRLARKASKRILMAYVGAGPIKTPFEKKIWKNNLERIDFISVRDTGSKAFILEELKVKSHKQIDIWKDPVFSNSQLVINGLVKKAIAVNVFVDCLEDRQKMFNLYRSIINILPTDYQVLLFTTERADDYGALQVCQSFSNKKNISVFCCQNIEEANELIVGCNLLIATRMHSLIIGLTQRIPCLALSWQNKVSFLMNDLKMNNDLFSLDEVINNSDNFFDRILYKINHNSDEKNAIETLMNNINIEIKENSIKLESLLEQ